MLSARTRKSMRWTAGIALPAKKKPKLFTIAPVSREGFTLALFSPWLRPCHFCLVNLEQKNKKKKKIQRNVRREKEKERSNDAVTRCVAWGVDVGVAAGLVVPRSFVSFERFRSNASRARPSLSPSSWLRYGEGYSRGDDNGVRKSSVDHRFYLETKIPRDCFSICPVGFRYWFFTCCADSQIFGE